MPYSIWNEDIIYNSVLENDFLDIHMAGITYPDTNYRIMHNIARTCSYDYYVFEYVVSGVGYIESSSGKMRVEGEYTYFLNKLHKHIYYPDKNLPYTKMFIVVKGAFVDALVNAFGMVESVFVTKVNTKSIFDKIFALLKESEVDYNQISHCLLDLLQIIKTPDYRLKLKSDDLAETIKTYLDNNLGEYITLDSISNSLLLSKSHIERVFKKKYQITPLKYFTEMKISYACTLLTETSYSIVTIADLIAFLDPKYLSKCVKARTGMTPMQYRKTKKEGAT